MWSLGHKTLACLCQVNSIIVDAQSSSINSKRNEHHSAGSRFYGSLGGEHPSADLSHCHSYSPATASVAKWFHWLHCPEGQPGKEAALAPPHSSHFSSSLQLLNYANSHAEGIILNHALYKCLKLCHPEQFGVLHKLNGLSAQSSSFHIFCGRQLNPQHPPLHPVRGVAAARVSSGEWEAILPEQSREPLSIKARCLGLGCATCPTPIQGPFPPPSLPFPALPMFQKAAPLDHSCMYCS